MRSFVASGSLALLAAVVLVTAVGCGGESDAELAARLAAARPGEVVQTQARVYRGSFEVPAGVVLQGDGDTEFRPTDGPAFRLLGGENTTLRGVRVAGGGAGVLATGPGAVVLEDVTIQVDTGYAVAADGVELTIRRVALRGVLDGESDPELARLGDRWRPDAVSVMGLVTAGCQLTIESLDITGFAGYGAALHSSNGSWSGGDVRGNVGVAVLVEDGEVAFDSVVAGHGLVGTGADFGLLSTGLLAAGGSVVETTAVQVVAVPGIGVLQDGARGVHRALRVEQTAGAGVWAQNADGETAPALEITGSETMLRENGEAGIHVRRVGGLRLTGIRIEQTRWPDGGSAAAEAVADALHLVGLSREVAVSGVTLAAPARAALLIDGTDEGGYGAPTVVVTNLQIDLGGDELGIVVQNGATVDPVAIQEETSYGYAASAGGGKDETGSPPPPDFRQDAGLPILTPRDSLPLVGWIGTNGLVGERGFIGPAGLIGLDFWIGTNGLVGPGS